MYQQPRRFVNRHRRKLLLSGTAFLAVNFVTSPSFACGGGPDPDSAYDEQSSTTKKKPKTKKEKQSIVMSQAKFLRLSPAQIRKYKSKDRADTIKIEGFSIDGSRNLYLMADDEHKLTHKLLKDMAKLKTKSTRYEHLRRERYRVRKLIKQLQKEKDNLPKTDAPETEKLLSKIFKKKTKADEIDARIQSLTYYLGGADSGVGGWSQSPMEGTLK